MAEAPEEIPPPGQDQTESMGCEGGTWWGGWIQAAKDKSASALEFVKKDIEEFTSTMQCDTESLTCSVRSKLNQETALAASQKMKHGMSVLLGGIKTALIIPPEDMDDESEMITVSSSQHIFDRAKARLYAVQIDPGTYCEDPTGPQSEFEAWRNDLNLDNKKGDISELLVANVEVRALYTQMVPSSVSHADFWQRYFYKLHQLDQEEHRRAELMKRADIVQTENDLAWDDDDDWENMEGGASTSNVTTETTATTTTTTDKDPPSKENVPQEMPSTEQVIASQTDAKHSTQGPCDSTNTPQTPSNQEAVPATHMDKSMDSVVTSPTDTVSTVSGTDSSSKDIDKDSSAETLTIVSAESPSEEGADNSVSADCSHDTDIKTKEKGDLVVVGGDNSNSTSERTSPSSSESNGQNKESLDEDWEKDFDIEVTEEDLQEIEKASKLEGGREGDEDWENWE